MFSSSRIVLLIVLSCSATVGMQAQSSSSQPEQPAAAPVQTTPTQAAPTQTNLTVQARIRARREQRRATAINDVYSHLYEAYVGGTLARTKAGDGVVAGKGLQKFNLYAWNVGFTRYFNEKLGVTLDGRGMYGTTYIGNNPYNVNHPAISQYSGMIGPTYRFLLHPKYSISGRVLGGVVYGNFSGDTDKFGTKLLGLYPDGTALAMSASVPVEYNLTPQIGFRIAPEYLLTSFGSTIQNGLGFTGGVVVRFGKQ